MVKKLQGTGQKQVLLKADVAGLAARKAGAAEGGQARRLAQSTARSTLGLLPEPLMATSRSPGPARFLSCSTKSRSKPSSLPQARMYGVLSVRLMMRSRFLRSSSRCSLAPPSELANCSTGKTQTQSTPWAPLILRLETSSGRSRTRSKPCNTPCSIQVQLSTDADLGSRP